MLVTIPKRAVLVTCVTHGKKTDTLNPCNLLWLDDNLCPYSIEYILYSYTIIVANKWPFYRLFRQLLLFCKILWDSLQTLDKEVLPCADHLFAYLMLLGKFWFDWTVDKVNSPRKKCNMKGEATEKEALESRIIYLYYICGCIRTSVLCKEFLRATFSIILTIWRAFETTF